jgi:hypothetical protein
MSRRLLVSFIVVLLCRLTPPAFAGQGCCSTHGGVAGCAGDKLKCNDGTMSATCSCQGGLAMLGATPPEAQPIVTPVAEPIPTIPADAVPPVQDNKPYVTSSGQPEVPTRGDTVPSQKPPEPYMTPVDNSSKGTGYNADGDTTEQTREKTPKSHPGEFESLKGTSAKKNVTTGEVWVKDKSAHGGEHWEVYKDQRSWEKGIRDRQVWKDGKTGKRY